MIADLEADALLERMPCGYVLMETDGAILYANETFRQMVGETDWGSQRRFQDFLAAGGALFYETQFRPTLLLRKTVREIALDLVTGSGNRVPVLVNAVVTGGAAGEGGRVVLTIFEASHRRLYEAELLRSRRESEQMAEVVRRSSDAILRLSGEGVIQSWNDGAQHTFGYTASEAIGRPLAELILTQAGQQEIETSLDFLKKGAKLDKELEASTKNGEKIEVSISLTPHLEPPGILVAFSAILRDITSRKVAERALVLNEKLASVGRLASSIAHEINNPLESVTNLLYLLRSHVTDGDAKSFVLQAESELARVSAIVTHTLRFQKHSVGRTLVDIGAMAESIMTLYSGRMKGSDIKSVIDCGRTTPLSCFDGEIRQILMNLTSNAFDALRQGGTLLIRSRDVRDAKGRRTGVRVLVADTGSGMSEQTVRRIFEPFYSTKGIGGTGLGLWITQDLVRKNGGSIRVRSRNKPDHHWTVMMLDFPDPSRTIDDAMPRNSAADSEAKYRLRA